MCLLNQPAHSLTHTHSLQHPRTPQGFYLISWDFQLLAHGSSRHDGRGVLSAAQAHLATAEDSDALALSQDIGFSILEKQTDGSFPQLKPYR